MTTDGDRTCHQVIGSAYLAWTVHCERRMISELRFLVAIIGFLGAGQLRYACRMDMSSGVIVVE